MGKKAVERELVIVKTQDMISAEVQTRGACIFANILDELDNRDLSEVKTKDLMEMAIRIMGFYVPKRVEQRNQTQGAEKQILDALTNAKL